MSLGLEDFTNAVKALEVATARIRVEISGRDLTPAGRWAHALMKLVVTPAASRAFLRTCPFAFESDFGEGWQR